MLKTINVTLSPGGKTRYVATKGPMRIAMHLPHGGVLYFPMVAKIGILPDCIELYRVSSHRGHRYYREEFIALEIECMY